MKLVLFPILIFLVFIYCLFEQLAYAIPSAINETKAIYRKAVAISEKRQMRPKE